MLVLNRLDQSLRLGLGKCPASLFGNGDSGCSGPGGEHHMIVSAGGVLSGHGGRQSKGVAVEHERLGIAVQQTAHAQFHIGEGGIVRIDHIRVAVGDANQSAAFSKCKGIVVPRGPGTVVYIQIEGWWVIDRIDGDGDGSRIGHRATAALSARVAVVDREVDLDVGGRRIAAIGIGNLLQRAIHECGRGIAVEGQDQRAGAVGGDGADGRAANNEATAFGQGIESTGIGEHIVAVSTSVPG